MPHPTRAGLIVGSILPGMREIFSHSNFAEPGHDGCGRSNGITHEIQEVIAVETDSSNEATAGAEELDVRALPHGSRHGIIFGKLDQLGPGESLIIANDHDPKPLRYQTSAMWPDRFDWSYLESGPQLWRVAITRVG